MPLESSCYSSSASSESVILCKSSDGDVVPVAVEVARQWKTFTRLYFGFGITLEEDGPATTFEFPVPLKTPILAKVIDWCRHHIDTKEPVVRENPHTGERIWFKLTEYEKRFFDVPVAELSELISAGNFLDIKSLYLSGCQSMAALINHKSPEEIRQLLGIEKDLTEEEENEIRKQNALMYGNK